MKPNINISDINRNKVDTENNFAKIQKSISRNLFHRDALKTPGSIRSKYIYSISFKAKINEKKANKEEINKVKEINNEYQDLSMNEFLKKSNKLTHDILNLKSATDNKLIIQHKDQTRDDGKIQMLNSICLNSMGANYSELKLNYSIVDLEDAKFINLTNLPDNINNKISNMKLLNLASKAKIGPTFIILGIIYALDSWLANGNSLDPLAVICGLVILNNLVCISIYSNKCCLSNKFALTENELEIVNKNFTSSVANVILANTIAKNRSELELEPKYQAILNTDICLINENVAFEIMKFIFGDKNCRCLQPNSYNQNAILSKDNEDNNDNEKQLASHKKQGLSLSLSLNKGLFFSHHNDTVTKKSLTERQPLTTRLLPEYGGSSNIGQNDRQEIFINMPKEINLPKNNQRYQ